MQRELELLGASGNEAVATWVAVPIFHFETVSAESHSTIGLDVGLSRTCSGLGIPPVKLARPAPRNSRNSLHGAPFRRDSSLALPPPLPSLGP